MKQKKQILLRVFFVFLIVTKGWNLRGKKKKKLPNTVTRLLNSFSVPLYVYLFCACQIGTSQSTLNWSF